MWGNLLQTGDWVRLTATIPVSVTDHLRGSGIPSGTRGVVVSKIGSRIEADFDTGYGTTRAHVPASKCRLIRRDGGQETFTRNANFILTARLALIVFLCWPVIQFTALYWWENKGFHGLVEELTIASFYSVGDMILSAINDPIGTFIYLLFIAVLSRIAFKH